MLQNAYFVAKIGADTAENEQHFAEILPIGRRGPHPPAQGSTGAVRLRRGDPEHVPELRKVAEPERRAVLVSDSSAIRQARLGWK